MVQLPCVALVDCPCLTAVEKGCKYHCTVYHELGAGIDYKILGLGTNLNLSCADINEYDKTYV